MGIQVGREIGQISPEDAWTLRKLGVVPDSGGNYKEFLLRIYFWKQQYLHDLASNDSDISQSEIDNLLLTLYRVPELASAFIQSISNQEKIPFYKNGQDPRIFNGVYFGREDGDHELTLSTRAFNALLRGKLVVEVNGLVHAEDLAKLSLRELESARTIGPKTIEVLESFLLGIQNKLGLDANKEALKVISKNNEKIFQAKQLAKIIVNDLIREAYSYKKMSGVETIKKILVILKTEKGKEDTCWAVKDYCGILDAEESLSHPIIDMRVMEIAFREGSLTIDAELSLPEIIRLLEEFLNVPEEYQQAMVKSLQDSK